jgi:prepilin-type N-terminal cleavage/methylation domain-containing protein
MTSQPLHTTGRSQASRGATYAGFANRNSRGYSLVEVLVAAAILAFGIAAAAILGVTMVSQQEGAAKVVRALNYQEQAGRLYQLGVSTNQITNILPPETSITSFSFSTSSVTVTNVGTVHLAEMTAVITISSRFSSGSPRTNKMAVIRPSTN